MNIKTRMIGVDLDGTLLKSNKELAPYTKEILKKAIDKGILVMPSTGRPLTGVPKELLEFPGIKYAVTANGARVIDITTGKPMVEELLAHDIAEKLMDVFEHYDSFREIYFEGVGYASREALENISKYLEVPAMANYISSTRIAVDDVREKFEEERFDEANRNLMKTQLFTNRVMTFMMPAMMLIMNCVTVMIVWFGAKGIDAGNLQVGDMMAFMTYTMQIVMSFLMITMVSVMLPRGGVAADRIEEILQTDSSIVDAQKTEDEKLTRCRGELTFEDVSFKYPGAEGDALEHISFTAKPGQTTAVIGSTGCGKSTLIQLIPRFYDVTEGKITLDGVDIRNLSQHKLREVMGLVPQKGVLFSGTIASNIKLAGEEKISDETMKEAAQTAQATEFIDAKPEGYDSPVAQGGSNVSGGQKQRLAIARVIAKHPKVYLFDDSFSALDYKTDAALRKALHEQAADATVLIVAQRISTIMNAEQILVLEDGKIVGKGTHKELMKNCSAYQEIARSQLSESELKGGMAE